MIELLGPSPVWDNHACMPLRPDDTGFLPGLEQVRAAGVDVMALNIAFGKQSGDAARAMAESFSRWVSARPGEFMLVRTVDDIAAAQASGRLGICFDIEGMDALDGDVEQVRRFYDLGVRWMLVAYNQPNAAGGGCLAPEDGGLTGFGRRVVAAMNEAGMVACGSHSGYRTARELIDASADPVIFSHSNPRAVWDHPRNIPDSLIRACAERGGVIGINGFGPFLGRNDASIETFAAHVEYVLDLAGEDHVGIALDYVFDAAELDEYIAADPATFPPELFSGGANMIAPWRLPEIAAYLHARGHGTATLAKLFGGNWMRVARAVWR